MNRVISNITHTSNNIPKLTLGEKLFKYVWGTITAPLGICTIQANNIMVITRFGKYDGYKEPGIRWIPVGCRGYEIFMGDYNKVQDNMYITDARGNPIIARTSVTYRCINPVNKVLNVKDDNVIHNYFESQIRKTLGKYTYDDILNNDIFTHFIKETNESSKMDEYGIEVERADLLDIKYSPEISQSMLMKQQAQAAIDARKYMVDNVVDIVNDISQKIGCTITDEDRSKLSIYLAVSLLTDKSPQMTYDISKKEV